jgi:hypothetical protein
VRRPDVLDSATHAVRSARSAPPSPPRPSSPCARTGTPPHPTARISAQIRSRRTTNPQVSASSSPSRPQRGPSREGKLHLLICIAAKTRHEMIVLALGSRNTNGLLRRRSEKKTSDRSSDERRFLSWSSGLRLLCEGGVHEECVNMR